MRKNKPGIVKDISIVVLFLVLSTLAGVLFRQWGFHESNVVVVYVFSVLLISRFTRGYVYGIASSVVALLLFNWFFTEPYYTLKVNDVSYFITFAIMTITSIVTGTLTTKVKQSATEAMEREKESNTLYRMTNHLTDAEDEDVIARVIIHTTSELLKGDTAYIIFDESGFPEKTFLQHKEDGSIIRRELGDREELYKRTKQLHNGVDTAKTQYYYPIYGIGYGTDTQALRALMAGLRRKIEAVPAKPRYILTEIGVGYRLVDE